MISLKSIILVALNKFRSIFELHEDIINDIINDINFKDA